MILHLTEQGLKVRKEGRRLQFLRNAKVLREVRLDDLEQIFVFGRVNFTAAATQALLKNETDVHFLTASGRYLGRLTAPRGRDVERRLAQFRAFEDPSQRLTLAKAFVAGKLENQRSFLRRQNRKLKDERVSRAILLLRQQIKELERAKDLEALRGIEGRAAFAYFEVFGRFFQVDGLSFPGRLRRPPPDPINALLSLGYTLLCTQIWSMVEGSGLDPYLGFMHAPQHGRPSLVLDLMEEWRPIIVDALVVRLFNWRTLKSEDFTEEPWDEEGDFQSVRLSNDGLRKFLGQFRQRLDEEAFYPPVGKRFSYRDIMQHQVWHLARVLEAQEATYQGFISV